jgi:hypothetical protein
LIVGNYGKISGMDKVQYSVSMNMLMDLHGAKQREFLDNLIDCKLCKENRTSPILLVLFKVYFTTLSTVQIYSVQ